MKSSGIVGNGTRKNWFNVEGDPESSLDPGIFQLKDSLALRGKNIYTFVYITHNTK